MQKWEYKLVWQHYDGIVSKGHFDPLRPSREAELNGVGEEGWELCGVTPTGERHAGVVLHFKRPKA